MISKFFSVYSLAIIVLLLTSHSSPGQNSNCLKVTGSSIRKSYELDRFTSLTVNLKSKIVLKTGKKSSITVISQRGLHKHLDKKIRNRELMLQLDTAICPSQPIKIHVTTNQLQSIILNTSGSITVQNSISRSKLKLTLNGSGTIDVKTNVEELYSNLNGAGLIKLTGRAKIHYIQTNSSGTVDAFYLTTNSTEINANGAGRIKVYSAESMEATIKGSAIVIYEGNPEINPLILGSGRIVPAD